MGTVLLEREPQLDALGRWWAEAAAGDGRIVFVAGEAGVGKTTLVRRFCTSIHADAGLLLGACEALATPVPLGPVLDMAVSRPAFHRVLDDGADPVNVRRVFLEELAANPAGTLAVVEDAHWADDATLDLLRHTGRRLAGRRGMVLVTYRDDEVGRHHPLRVLMGDLATLPEVRRLRLRPLSVDAVARLAEGSGLDPGDLHGRTGGNPFFLTEVLAAGAAAVPGSVRDAVLARASRLGTAAREVLEAAACLGARTGPDLVEQVSGHGAEALDECLESGMLVLDGDELTFRHELARLAVAETVPARRATGCHQRALAALRRLPPEDVDPARLADHAERAGDRAAVFDYAWAAAERASRLASHREAAAYYARAVAAADDQPDDVRAGLLEVLAFERYMSLDLYGAREAADGALRLWRRLGDRPRMAHNLLSQVNVLKTMGEWLPELEPTVHQAIALLEELPPSPALALAWSMKGVGAVMAFRNAEAEEWAARALALAEDLHDDPARSNAMLWLGLGRAQGGDERGWALAEECRQAALAGRPDEWSSWAVFWPYHVALMTRRYARADELYAEAMAYVLEHGLETTRQFLLAWRGRQLLEHGRWDDAEALVTAVLDASDLGDGRRLMALETLARIRLRRGADAGPLLDEARRVEEPGKPVVEWMLRVPCALAEQAWLSGQADEVRRLLEPALARAAERGEPWFLGETAFWLWRVGALAEAPGGMAAPYALLLAGRAQESYEAWAALGCPFEAARSLACADDPAALRQALATFDELGAQGERDEAARRLRRLGFRDIPKPRWRPGADPTDVLSRREADVLALLGEGLRNAEIAGRLFLSERTVEHHVAAVLRKLGVPSRVEAGRLARASGVRLTS